MGACLCVGGWVLHVCEWVCACLSVGGCVRVYV